MRRVEAATVAVVLAVIAAQPGSQPPASAASPCASAPASGSRQLQLTAGGASRSAVLHVPPAIPAGRPLPLVIAVHGYGGNGAKMERYSGFSKIADRSGFAVVYPSSDGPGWNSTAAAGQPDDVAFFTDLITYVRETICVNPDRVYATGVSNGGGMVALAGCELSDQIAAIATVAGGYDNQPPCRPSRPLSLLEIHGTADQVVGYFGGSQRPTANGLPRFVNGWIGRDGCAPRARVRSLAARTIAYTWRGCTSGVSLEHIRINGGKHQWPGATPPDPGPPATICASCTIWDFFARLPTGVREWSSSGGAGLPA